MRWILAKIALLAGTVWAAIAGAGGSQAVAFVGAYLQRLGGHIDEVRVTLRSLDSGEMAASIRDPVVREQLTATFQARLAELEASRDAILDASAFWRPVAMLGRMDREIAERTAAEFTPAVPLDLPSLLYAGIAIVVALAIWEAGAWPVRRRFGRSRRAFKGEN